MRAVRRRGQVAAVAVFLELLLQRLHLLTEPLELVLHLGNLLISLRQLFLPLTLFLSQLLQFFFGCHVATLSAFPSFDKSSRTPSQLQLNKQGLNNHGNDINKNLFFLSSGSIVLFSGM